MEGMPLAARVPSLRLLAQVLLAFPCSMERKQAARKLPTIWRLWRRVNCH